MGEDSNQVTTVKIYHQTYQVRSGDDPEYIKRLAQYVDETMTEVFESTSSVDSIKVAVLAALNIADDYYRAQETLERRENEIKQRAQDLSERLLAALEPLNRASGTSTE